MSRIQKPPTTGYRFVMLAVILPSSFTLELKCGRPLNSVQQYTVRFAVLFEMFNALHSNLFLIDITTKKNLVKVEIRVILNFMLCNSIFDSIKNLRAYASLGLLVVTVPSPAMRYACVRVGKSRCLMTGVSVNHFRFVSVTLWGRHILERIMTVYSKPRGYDIRVHDCWCIDE